MTDQLYQDNFPHMTPAWSRIFSFVADLVYLHCWHFIDYHYLAFSIGVSIYFFLYSNSSAHFASFPSRKGELGKLLEPA